MKIVWLGSAKRDLRRIQSYYDAIGTIESGNKAVRQIAQKCLLLETFPFLGVVVTDSQNTEPKFRKLVADKYVVYYWVENEEVIISAVMDGRKDPLGLRSKSL